MKEQYPFGEVVKKVEQKDKKPKEWFVLGVYASAVHAKWIGNDGRIKIKALAVASEPEIFWKGDRERGEKIISQITVPKEVGRLELADERFNGPSGIELDKSYLEPLNLTRREVWLCDLMPYSRLNDEQVKAINREYEPMRLKYGLSEVTLNKVPSRFSNEERAEEILAELRQSKARKIILLGDVPIREFINRFIKKSKLSDFGEYGNAHELKIDGEEFNIFPLVHPRQAGKLGNASSHWYNTHKKWIENQKNKRHI
jgi:uracil-DNA glycosylase